MTQSLPPKSLILYADDDPDDLDLVKDLFAKYETVVDLVTFDNGLQLLQYIKRSDLLHNGPCLVILDVNMPLIDGKENLKRLRSMDGCSDVPIVLFTTSSQPHEAAFAHKYNAAFITKPLHAAQAHMIVDRMLEHCAPDVQERIRKLR